MDELITHRAVRVRELSFEEWLDQEHIDKSGLYLGDMYANIIAELALGKPGFATRRTNGKRKGLYEKLQRTQQFYKTYLREVPEVIHMIPLDPTKAADQAYVRVMQKRRGRAKKAG